ncbi:MAG: GEVED domain-containing protein, partial [Bacteroidota bacterium]
LTILMDNDCTAAWPNGTLVHELGHTFNLAHTHSGTERGNTNSNAEHVPRSGANSNCTTDGDMLCDTPADPNGSNDSNCNFVNDGNSQQDIYGNTYAPAINNVMSYYSDACGGILTPDQYTRIANALITRQGHSAYNLTGCGPTNVTNASNLTAAISASYTVDLNWMDNANNETGYLIERSEDNGLTWKAVVGGGVAPDVTTFVDDTAEGNRTYQYRVKASNDNCNDYSNVATINTGALYCIPSHQSNSCTVFGTRGVAIYDFQMRESGGGTTLINNNNNACNGPLSVYTASYSANVMPGSSYEVEVDFRFGGSGSYTTQNIAIWVDLDQNGSFTDAGEMLYQSTPSNASTIIAPFTIPANAMAGSTTLRVRSGFSGNGLMTDPCNYRAFSEAEDYGIVIGSANGVEVNVKAFLQGAFDVSGLMRDDLRVAGYIPMTEPYTNLAGFTHIDGGGEMVQSNVLNVTGNDAIVDWVFLELRDKNSPSTVLHTRSALLQRDGDIVDVDGGSTPVRFDMAPPDDYYIVVRHRNHLAVRTPAVQSLSATASTYDFSTGSGQAVGTEPMAQPTAGVFAMWGGNAKADDNYVRVTPRVFPPPSLASDRTYILDDILSGDPNGTYMGYSTGDVNMDGIVRITPRVFPPPTIPSDATYIIDNILDGDPNATRTEQQ